MDIEQAIKQTAQDYLASSKANTRQMFADRTVPAQPQSANAEMQPSSIPPQDFFQNRQKAARDLPATEVYGASPKIMDDLDLLMQNGIVHAYKKALDDSELLYAEGETERARIIVEQYMNNWFQPVVDALVRMNSQQEVLASVDALEALDALALVPGGGQAEGYTSVFVSSLYEPVAGQTFSSDAEVVDAIRRMNGLLDQNQVRMAGSVARRLLTSLDMGQNRATPDDYEFIQKIALRTA